MKAWRPSEFNQSIERIPLQQPLRKVLMCKPDHFDIVDVKNVHMRGAGDTLNKKLAKKQWSNLLNIYQKLSSRNIIDEVAVIESHSGLEDMVFAANQSFAWCDGEGNNLAVMGNMVHVSRQREIPFYEQFYRENGCHIIHLNRQFKFEGCGDAIVHPGKKLIYGGHGFRSEEGVYDEIAERLQTHIIKLRLTDPRFYHLDTCFLPLSVETVLLYPKAFDPLSLTVIKKLFKNVISIPEEEAASFFALNAHCLFFKNHKVVIIQTGTTVTQQQIKKTGFEVIETDTSEFMISGGSVFCLKMMWG